ncbi:MAG TPA: TonB-dependent receptor plug domain-containing protein, partial [Candidatus Cloacimonadota bacterium]|nr:TonB-dependent receptor plug domain-containing protein [Candidatus Cloacimonadota bacterium]
NWRSTADVLENRADLIVIGSGLAGEARYVSVPGFQTRHTLIMLDGVALNKSGEAFDISSIPVEIIKNIEITKGSSGNSMGAVININTRNASGKLSAAYNHTLGSFGLDKHAFTFSGSTAGWNGYLLLAKSYARNDFKYKVPSEWNLPKKYYIRKFNDKNTYDVNVKLSQSNRFFNTNYKLIFQDYLKKLPGTIINPDLYLNSRQKGQTWRHFLNLEKDMKKYQLKADLAYSKENSTYDNTRLEPPFNSLLYKALSTTDQSIKQVKLHTEYAQDDFYFDWGGGYKNEAFSYDDKLNDANSISQKYLEKYTVFANTKLEKNEYPSYLKLIAAANWDYSKRYHDFTGWRIAPEYTYKTLFDIVLGGSVANGINYPSFLSLYWKGDTQTTGNPDLKPEKSLGWQIFQQLKWGENYIKVNYRDDKLQNMITWFLEHNSKWKPRNVEKAQVLTWEFETQIQPVKSIILNGMYSWVKAKNKTRSSDLYNNDIIYTPRNKLFLQAKFIWNELVTTVSYSRTGKQNYTFDQQSSQQLLPAYGLLNAGISYGFSWHRLQYTVGMDANNILDKKYEIYRYIPQPGFNWNANLGVQWKL